ncbi:MAG: dockerin type I domain-containing protein [Candidatus Bathyarchaeia archaeon]
MKAKLFAGLAIAVLVLSIFQITLKITPAVFSSNGVAYKEIWQVINVTNTHGSMTTSGDINIELNNRTGVNIAWSTDITRFYENFTYWSSLGYATYMDWLNGTITLPYHWGEIDWYVSEGSLTPISWDEIKFWWDMYRDSGGGVSYSTFMGNTYMADFNFTDPTNDPDIIRYNLTQVGVPWVGNVITVKDLVIPANTTIYLVLKIVITLPGAYTFSITSPNPLLQISPSNFRTGGASTILVPDEFSLIQDAINYAKAGDTIVVLEGVYAEQLVINKPITLQGVGGNTIIRPFTENLTQIFDGLFWYGTPDTKNIAGVIVANVTGIGNVTLRTLKVDCSAVTAKPTGADYVAGIFYRETGGLINNVTIVGTGAWSGDDRAYGIYLSAASKTVYVEVAGSTIMNYDKNAIEAMGNKLTYNIHNNVIIGRGAVDDEVQNGVNAGRGSAGTVNNNVISNMSYTPETWWSAAILFIDSTGQALNNLITDCQIGVFFRDSNGSAINNVVNGTSVGLLGVWAEYTKAGAWTNSFVNNIVNYVRDSPGWNNSAIGAATYIENANLTIYIADNKLVCSGSTDADGIYIGDDPSAGGAGNIAAIVRGNMIVGWENGIRLLNSINVGTTIVNNTIANATGVAGILIESNVNASNVKVNYNNVTGNPSGITNNGFGMLDARFNWWGNETGPYNPTFNPQGSGDSVSDNVEFKPWLVQPYPPAVPVSQLYVDPQLIECWTGLNTTFTVKVKLDDVRLLYGFQFKLTWNSTLLNLTSASYTTLWADTYLWRHDWNNTLGEYRLALSGRGNVPSFNGSATLATLSFKILYEPLYPETVMTSLSLVDTLLSRSQNLLEAEPIPHIVRNGTYICNYTLPTLKPAQPQYVIKRVPIEFEVNITLTYVVNLENFEFTLTYDPSLLTFLRDPSDILVRGTTWTISWTNGSVSCYSRGISPGVNGTLTIARLKFRSLGFVWNTVNRSVACDLLFSFTNLTGPEGTPIVHVVVNGTYIYKPVPGDLDMDGTVTIIDLAAAARAFGTRMGEPGWFDIADVNCDGIINILDIVIIARNFGRTEPEP